eukprot:364591-Chlamydomonas_euryale.AAC.10
MLKTSAEKLQQDSARIADMFERSEKKRRAFGSGCSLRVLVDGCKMLVRVSRIVYVCVCGGGGRNQQREMLLGCPIAYSPHCAHTFLHTPTRHVLPAETVDGRWDHLMYRLIPINSLRNAALVAAETPLVLMADADLVVSASLSRQMANASMCVAGGGEGMGRLRKEGGDAVPPASLSRHMANASAGMHGGHETIGEGRTGGHANRR